ncbi:MULTISPECIES: hypothetical protein [Aeromonas]|uniref:hypothetical protein n=1 Tax=Aeromonas TaxID=642 RepID=UPI001C2373D6|nr:MULTISPECIES: hypothetical protein [Aeromonas]QXC33127.1 hypothetical protein I6L37_16245 [Aeromonas sp. FDAARGOS 1407]UAK70615.1 hypothetical protein K8O95_13000 [Aeromonas enteropelogenes]
MSLLPSWITPAIQANVITTQQAERLLASLYQPLAADGEELPADLADISLKLYCFRQQGRVRH